MDRDAGVSGVTAASVTAASVTAEILPRVSGSVTVDTMVPDPRVRFGVPLLGTESLMWVVSWDTDGPRRLTGVAR